MSMNIWHITGILITMALIIGIGILSGKKVKNASDFTTGGGKATALLVCGAILGSLVSGQATIGTAQLAFSYGLSAWWFTLGSGIGCLILGIAYVIPLRHSGNMTLLEVISDEYGKKAEYIGSVLCSIGIFISVIAQVLSATALLTTIFSMNAFIASILSITLMIIYVVFGGAWGAGMGGVLKLFLLYLASIAGCAIVIITTGGISEVTQNAQSLILNSNLSTILDLKDSQDFSRTFVNLLARGTAKDLGSGLSTMIGVLSTQTYAQAIWSGESHSAARRGAFLSACLIPPIGVACTLIGLFMRSQCITTDEIAAIMAAGHQIPSGLIEITSSSQVFPAFILNYMPSLIGGIVLGTLLITVVGGGAGLSLGVATILVNDIFKKITSKIDTPGKNLVCTRATIVVVLLSAMIIALLVPGAIINDFGFLSMGLRGTVIFLPMSTALYLKGKIASRWIIISMILGPLTVVIGKIMNFAFDPLFIGIGVCLVCLIIGFMIKNPINKFCKYFRLL